MSTTVAPTAALPAGMTFIIDDTEYDYRLVLSIEADEDLYLEAVTTAGELGFVLLEDDFGEYSEDGKYVTFLLCPAEDAESM